MPSSQTVLLAAIAVTGIAVIVDAPTRQPLPHHPHDIISASAFSPGYPEDPRMFVASPGTINLFLTSADHGLTWEPSRSGIRGEVFREIALASDWVESGVMYVITEDGGLQVSSNWGKTWDAPTCDKRLKFLAVPPVNSSGGRTLFFAAGHAMFGSLDGGATYRGVFRPNQGHIESIAVSPQFEHDSTLLVGTSGSLLHVSRDGGKSWRETQLPKSALHIEVSPNFATDKTVWIATWGAGVMRSQDGGATFEASGSGLTDLDVNDVQAAPGTTSFELFACTRNEGVFYSMDSGLSWTHTALRVNKTTQTDNHYTSLALSPAWPEDKTVLCGSFEGLNVSRDGGTTWRESNVNPVRIGRIVAVSPTYRDDKHVFACGYGMHLLVSPDGADSWDIRFSGLNADSVYAIAASPDYTESKTIMLGVFKGVRRSMDGGHTWRAIAFDHYPGQPKDGYTTRAITYSPGFPADKRVFAIGTRGLFVRSDDLGASWKNGKIVTTWATGVALSPDFANDQTLIVSGRGIFISKDAGETFSGPMYPGHLYGNYLTCAPDFKESGEAYAIARFDGFVIGSKGGMVWKPSNDGLEGYAPAAMRLSPRFAVDKTIYLLTSGGGLFRSGDRGRSWQRVTALGGPVDQGFSLVLSPEFQNDQTMFAGTFSGFWRSRDAGVTWQPTSRLEVYDEKRDPWLRRGTWIRQAGHNPINNTISHSKVAGDEMSISFQGIACRLVGPKGPDFGIYEITLDDKPPIRMDQFAPLHQDQQTLFEASSLDTGNHRLSIMVTGEKSPASHGVRIGVDAIEIVFR